MSAEPVALLKSVAGVPIPLQRVNLDAAVEGCLSEVTVEQHYLNVEAQPIEAVYSFPLPMRAVLLSVELTIGERTLKGVVQRKREAAEVYEQAIEQGHTGMLLEKARDGLFTVALGNLLPQQTAVIRLRYAQLLSVEQACMRLMIPTAFAPRYGDAGQALQAHQVPATDLTAHYPCRLLITVRGELSQSVIDSPTHRLASQEEPGQTRFESGPDFVLDRDFVLLLQGIASPLQSLVARDGDGYVALASFTAPDHAGTAAPSRAIKLVVDCSGSMAGASIAQARTALAGVLQALSAQDSVSLTRFGSHWEHATGALQRLTPSVLTDLQAAVRETDATLGGTVMLPALTAVMALPVPEGIAADVLLITDGEIWEIDDLLEKLAAARHRLFVLAVGTSPVEELARKVATLTRGACEFVTPGEDMGAAVSRLLARMGSAVLRVGNVEWPAQPTWSLGAGDIVFPGDTGQVVAGFSTPPSGSVTVSVVGGARELQLQCGLATSIDADGELARIVAARRLTTMGREEAAQLAERYQLVTEHTSCVLVLERAAAASSDPLPALRAVPQMLSAGWGGTGTLVRGLPAPQTGVALCAPRQRPSAAPVYEGHRRDLPDRDVTYSDVTAFFRQFDRQNRPHEQREPDPPSPARSLLGARLTQLVKSRQPLPTTILELLALGVDEELLQPVRALLAQGHREADVVAAWLAEFIDADAASPVEPRLRARLLRAADRSLRRLVRTLAG